MGVGIVSAGTDKLREIRDLKTKAKNRRDIGRFEHAMSVLQRAADLAEETFAGTLEGQRTDFVDELADIYGMMGGVARRQALEAKDVEEQSRFLGQSIDYYDKGYLFESRNDATVSSYNLVNRLVSRIIADPATLQGASLGTHPFEEEEPLLEMVQRALESVAIQLEESDIRDIWSLADYALLEILASTSVNATKAYGPLHRMSPPSYVYESALATLRPLASAAGAYRPELVHAILEIDSRFTGT